MYAEFHANLASWREKRRSFALATPKNQASLQWSGSQRVVLQEQGVGNSKKTGHLLTNLGAWICASHGTVSPNSWQQRQRKIHNKRSEAFLEHCALPQSTTQ